MSTHQRRRRVRSERGVRRINVVSGPSGTGHRGHHDCRYQQCAPSDAPRQGDAEREQPPRLALCSFIAPCTRISHVRLSAKNLSCDHASLPCPAPVFRTIHSRHGKGAWRALPAKTRKSIPNHRSEDKRKSQGEKLRRRAIAARSSRRWLELPRKRRVMSFKSSTNGPSTSMSNMSSSSSVTSVRQ